MLIENAEHKINLLPSPMLWRHCKVEAELKWLLLYPAGQSHRVKGMFVLLPCVAYH